MSLSVAQIKATIKAKREAALGTPDDSVLADTIYQADAEAIFEILTMQAVTVLGNGLDTNGDTLINLTGTLT